jgi:hypothetical protein
MKMKPTMKMKEMKSSHLLHPFPSFFICHSTLLLPFWCLDAKGEKSVRVLSSWSYFHKPLLPFVAFLVWLVLAILVRVQTFGLCVEPTLSVMNSVKSHV